MANRFQSAFAAQHINEDLRVVAHEWPLWRASGLNDAEAEDLYLESSGQILLETDQAMGALEAAIFSGRPRTLVLSGETERLNNLFVAPPRDKPVIETGDVLASLKELAADQLKMSPDEFAVHKNLASFGFDSIGLSEFARSISTRFGIEIAPSVFFSHATLEKLAAHLR
ncbi:MAG: hypothetical protein KTR32_34465, partial [Granulosicoccus sp.]|nr:hypothetical protein [Granulosicoccus sp.]